jgi:hypothetical protein
MKYISELHNGYAFVLYKTGIIEFASTWHFLYLLYIRMYHYQDVALFTYQQLGFFNDINHNRNL